jgi:hypothetical protein
MFEVGIKRKFWFGYTRYVVKKAFIRGYTRLYDATDMAFDAPINPYLVLIRPDGTEFYISDIERRDWYSKEFKDGLSKTSG